MQVNHNKKFLLDHRSKTKSYRQSNNITVKVELIGKEKNPKGTEKSS